jgi:hypothetical protein
MRNRNSLGSAFVNAANRMFPVSSGFQLGTENWKRQNRFEWQAQGYLVLEGIYYFLLKLAVC